MNIDMRSYHSIATIAAIALSCNTGEISVKQTNTINDETYIDIVRTMPIAKMKSMNKFFGTNIRDNTLWYRITIDKDENISFNRHTMETVQLYFLFDISKDLDAKVKGYDESITKNLNNHKELFLEVIKDNHSDIKSWVFFFISKGVGNRYLGFANGDLNNKHCIKVYDYIEPEGAYKFKGSEPSAKTIRLKRNYNSQYDGSWLYAETGFDFNQLR